MGLEAGNFVSDLVITNPDGAVDAASTIDDHLRLIKKCIKQTFPNLSSEVSATASDFNILVGRRVARRDLTSTISGAWTHVNATFQGSITEEVFAVTGTTPALNPANGTIQTWTLTGNSTPTDSLSAGGSITLMIDDGTAYTVTWPTMTWFTNGGVAPSLATSGYTVVNLWKVGSTLYGAAVGT